MASLFSALFKSLFQSSFLQRWALFLRLHFWGPRDALETLSPHLLQMKKDAEELAAAHPMEDMFRPSFATSDGSIVATIITRTISFYFTTNVFIKRQPHTDEMGIDLYGDPVVVPYIDNRLRNEAAALQFISQHTSIPVPKFLGLWEENGLLYLKTGLVHNCVELRHVDKLLLATAVEKVTAQLESEIIPQLQKLRRNFIGSADESLPVIVPHLLWSWKDKRTWPQVTSETNEYVFVHTDLDRQNILVDPHTFRIVSIVDWETAGFFPPDWELPKWKMEERTPEKRRMQVEAGKHQRAFFGPDFANNDK